MNDNSKFTCKHCCTFFIIQYSKRADPPIDFPYAFFQSQKKKNMLERHLKNGLKESLLRRYLNEF